MSGKALHAAIAAVVRGAATAAGKAVDPIEQVQEAPGTLGVTDVKKRVNVLKEAGEKHLAGRLRKASRLRNAQAHPDVNLVTDIEDKLAHHNLMGAQADVEPFAKTTTVNASGDDEKIEKAVQGKQKEL
eukprot:8075127-Pyramimonas_sp.AAC.1